MGNAGAGIGSMSRQRLQWLDENLVYANAWRHRDYVIAALTRTNRRPIHSRAVVGDLLLTQVTKPEYERWIATGFSLGAKMLAEDDP